MPIVVRRLGVSVKADSDAIGVICDDCGRVWPDEAVTILRPVGAG